METERIPFDLEKFQSGEWDIQDGNGNRAEYLGVPSIVKGSGYEEFAHIFATVKSVDYYKADGSLLLGQQSIYDILMIKKQNN